VPAADSAKPGSVLVVVQKEIAFLTDPVQWRSTSLAFDFA
jgi:hypothetical protein